MEERYNQPISAGNPKGFAGAARPKSAANAMGNASVIGVANDRMPNIPNTGMPSGSMPNLTNNMNAGMMPAKPNMGAPADVMPEKAPVKPNTANLPAGTLPNMMKEPNASAMPLMSKPITGLMPEMNSAKPNTGMMPEMMPAKPNTGRMPGMLNQPIIGAMPYMANPNMGMMPDMTVKPNENAETKGCGYNNGELPPCAPLSVGFVPFQEKNPPKYERGEALTRGTLFPGLDLPWKNIVNKTNPYAGTPLGELMALGFVIEELNLYLDTHPHDKDALDMLQQFNRLMQEGVEKYVRLYGPQMITDIMSGDKFTWIDNPWPWEYTEKGASDNHV